MVSRHKQSLVLLIDLEGQVVEELLLCMWEENISLLYNFSDTSGFNQVPSRGFVAIHGTGHQISRMWNPGKIARQPEIGWRPQDEPYLQLLEIFQLFNKRYAKDLFLIKGLLNIILYTSAPFSFHANLLHITYYYINCYSSIFDIYSYQMY